MSKEDREDSSCKTLTTPAALSQAHPLSRTAHTGLGAHTALGLSLSHTVLALHTRGPSTDTEIRMSSTKPTGSLFRSLTQQILSPSSLPAELSQSLVNEGQLHFQTGFGVEKHYTVCTCVKGTSPSLPLQHFFLKE